MQTPLDLSKVNRILQHWGVDATTDAGTKASSPVTTAVASKAAGAAAESPAALTGAVVAGPEALDQAVDVSADAGPIKAPSTSSRRKGRKRSSEPIAPHPSPVEAILPAGCEDIAPGALTACAIKVGIQQVLPVNLLLCQPNKHSVNIHMI